MRNATKPVYLILDGHPVHRSGKVSQFVDSLEGQLRLFFLPPYSPELNPDELAWNHLKNHKTGKSFIAGPDDLKVKVLSWMKSLQSLPSKIMGFFRHPDVSCITY